MLIYGYIFFEALYSYCILRIYSATQGYNFAFCSIMMKIAVEGCKVPLKGGGRGAYWRAYSWSLFYDVRRHGVE